MVGGLQSRDDFRQAGRFDALDGLRALAAAAVVWHHCLDRATGFFTRSVGVTTFFVISGFLITRLLLKERRLTGTISVRRFWLRRSLRIMPLYYAVLATYVALVPLVEGTSPAAARFWDSLPHYATFTTNWFVTWAQGERVIFYFAWSLAVQEQFYLAWPLVLRYARPRAAILLPLAFLLTEELAEIAVGAGWSPPAATLRVLTTFDSPIFLGVLIAMLLDSEQGFRLAARVAARSWAVPAGFAAVLLAGSLPGAPAWLIRGAVTYLVLACVLVAPAVARLVEHPVLRHVGNVSYGIYLLHMLLLTALRRLLPGQAPGTYFALGFPLAVLAATVSHRWYEGFFMRLRDALTGVSPGAPVGGAASAGKA
jgi:peptidoglycan/LPS O-acetylase OafA/YrhL